MLWLAEDGVEQNGRRETRAYMAMRLLSPFDLGR